MTLQDIVTRILSELDDSSITVTSCALWCIGNISLLNQKLKKSYVYTPLEIEPDEDTFSFGDFVDELAEFDSLIYIEMYLCNYLSKKARKLGAISQDWIELSGSEQGTIRRSSSLSQSQEIRQQYTLCEARVKALIALYKKGDLLPLQILYNQRLSSSDSGILCPCFALSSFF